MEGKNDTSVAKKDSGIDLETRADLKRRQKEIPSFHHPHGVPQHHLIFENEWKWMSERLDRLLNVTETNQDGDEMSERDLVPVTIAVGLSRYLNASLYRKVFALEGKVNGATFKK